MANGPNNYRFVRKLSEALLKTLEAPEHPETWDREAIAKLGFEYLIEVKESYGEVRYVLALWHVHREWAYKFVEERCPENWTYNQGLDYRLELAKIFLWSVQWFREVCTGK